MTFIFLGDEYEDDDLLVEEEEGYTGRPISVPSNMAGTSHHPNCTYVEGDALEYNCICAQLYEKRYRQQMEEEEEERHAEYWT